ncbi:hypothetical protein [Streptomyces sasae]|uniref:hypothetical protein n=1 Tax=Streptomyces sasae TaxID=1266772 RepID=UPI00292E8C02|nr:hypothetical protein [Streptomyces sasae]
MGFIALVMLALVIGGVVALVTRRQQQAGGGGRLTQQDLTADAGAEATRWVDRLGGGIATLDGGDDRAARQALADAAERHRAAQAQLATAYTPAQYALVTQTAVEGLHYVRAARTALGLDPGPALPPAGTATAGRQVTVGGQTYTSSDHPGAGTPYYYPGGTVGGRTLPGGWYSTPWWKTALVAGAAGVGGMLLADALFDGFHHHGPPMGGPGGPGGPGGFGGFGGPGFF